MAHGCGVFVGHTPMLHRHIQYLLLVSHTFHLPCGKLQKIDSAFVDLRIIRIFPKKILGDREGIPAVFRTMTLLRKYGPVFCFTRMYVENSERRQLIDAVPEDNMLIVHKGCRRSVVIAAGNHEHLSVIDQGSALVSLADPKLRPAFRQGRFSGIHQIPAVRALRLPSVHSQQRRPLVFADFFDFQFHIYLLLKSLRDSSKV